MKELVSISEIIAEDFQKTFGGLTGGQLNWKPGEKEWSVAQCVEHLVITNNLYFENIQKVADGNHKNNIYSKIPLIPNLTGLVMKKVLSPEWRPKIKTFEMFKPAKSSVREDILEVFDKNQRRLISLMDATKNLEVRKIKVAEPIGRAVNLRLIDAFEILVVHEKRHFNQAKRVLNLPEFPK